jgi:hypothetical protein
LFRFFFGQSGQSNASRKNNDLDFKIRRGAQKSTGNSKIDGERKKATVTSKFDRELKNGR